MISYLSLDIGDKKAVTETDKVSSTVTEKMKSLKLPERLRNLNITYSDVGHAG